MKGSPFVSSYVEKQFCAKKDAEDATLAILGVSAPQLELFREIQSLLQVDA